MSKELDQEYARIMKNHPYGIALYRPLPHSIFNPGACGYFDDFGAWNPIAHLESDAAILSKKGLKAVEDEMEKAPVEDGIKWGPMTSSNVRSRKTQLSGGVDAMALGIPAGASVTFSYSVEKDVGALLLTKAPIVHEHYYHTSPFKNWCRVNSLPILSRWPEVKKHGLWIVTSAYTTKECAINMWNAHGKSIEVGFSVDVTRIGSIGPGNEWSHNRSDEGWGEYTAKDNDSSVVFFGGLKFQYSWLTGSNLKPTTNRPYVHRGSSEQHRDGPETIDFISDPENDEGYYSLDCEAYLAEDDEAPPAQDLDDEW